ncbi:hypothetical protein HWV07_10480 [Natronomonas salina]|uniref:DUF7344 domain-containing protein n=1 Tax=Natronomonas salina TaxID=1710540 RepID=UPI0015B45272|nr:hypothetical protein [Natronomonas salina]QLD89432.1 hypothetical protein HWV07_10480 [Natronomonas salina]
MQAPTDPTDSDRERTAVDAPLDRDELFALLQSGRRRRVVRHLLEFVGEPMPVDALATAIARREHETPSEGLDASVRERVEIALDHAHLPQLAAADVVEYDRDRGRVTATPEIEALEPYLDDGPDAAPAAGRAVRLALAGLAGGAVAAAFAWRNRIAEGVGAGTLAALLVWLLGRDDESS